MVAAFAGTTYPGTYVVGSSITLDSTGIGTVTAGDILIASLHLESGSLPQVTVPTGWTIRAQVEATASGGFTNALIWKRATASEPTTYTFSLPSGTSIYMIGVLYRVSGAAATGDPFGGHGVLSTQVGTSIGSVSYTASGAGLGFWSHASYSDNLTITQPTGYTKQVNTGNGSFTFATRTDAAGARTTGTGTNGTDATEARITIAGVILDTPSGTAQSAAASLAVTATLTAAATVTTAAPAGVVNPGPTQANIEPYSTVTLSASVTSGTAPTWAQTGGSPTVTLGGSGSVRTFTAPATMNGTTLTFTATSGANTASTTVTMLPHNAWRFDNSMVLVPRRPTNLYAATTPSTVAWKPVIKPAVNGTGAQLQRLDGTRLKLAGVNVWGIADLVTGVGTFAQDQYTNRNTVINTIQTWGANHVRFRMLANNGVNGYLTPTQQVDQIVEWVRLATAAGMYSSICWWDSFDGYAEDANWPTRYASAFSQMQAVTAAVGSTNPYVFYEPFHEPNSFGAAGSVAEWDQWLVAMKATVDHFRVTCGYRGVLAVDTIDWSRGFSDSYMSQLEAWDASRAGMTQHQLMFARHDYAADYATPGSGFDSTTWVSNTGGSATAHVLYESDFGNTSGGVTNITWSQSAASYLGLTAYTARSNYAGGAATLFGPWSDGNATTSADNTTPTTWGVAAKDFITKSAVVNLRPPAT